MNKLPSLLLGCLLLLMSCKPSPEQLAQNACDCNKKLSSMQNSDNKLQQVDECNHVYQIKYSQLKDMEKEQDMTSEQTEKFEKRFENIYNNCK